MTRPKPHGRESAGTRAAEGHTGAHAEPARASAAAGAGRMPDFFIAGHQKCGTTALYLMLSEHPQIFMPQFKEPRYFASELRRPHDRETPDRPHTLERYLTLFAGAQPGQRAGEASPQYIRSPTAASRIAELNPDARMIVILREPAAFLRSFHMQMVASHEESEKDLRKALALEEPRRSRAREQFVPPQLLYSEHVRYAEQLRRLHASFSAQQVLVLIYEEFRADNEAAVRRVQRFLDVDDTAPLRAVETKPLNTVRSMRMHELRRRVRHADFDPDAAGLLSRAMATLVPKELRRGMLSKAFRGVAYSHSRPTDERLMLELRRRFADRVEEASEYLGRDLVALWGYDRLR
jgi:Sulfotransferase domain